MKNKKFLSSIALSIAALVSSISENDKALLANANISTDNTKNTHIQAGTQDDGKILHDFVLSRNENNELMAYHRSHYSHRSHSSHSSHRSHYSGY